MLERARSIVIVQKPSLRKRHSLSFRAIAGIVLLAFVTLVLHGNWSVALVLVGGGLGAWQLWAAVQCRREREAVLADIAILTDSEFLRYTADLLRAQGYGVLKIGQADNAHGNLLLMHGEQSLACRVLRARYRLGKTEMTRTLARVKLYGCKGAMVLTNRVVSWTAARFARRVGCLVIDRNEIVRLIMQYRQGHRVYVFQRQEATKLRRRK
jgi:hypothetical protein